MDFIKIQLEKMTVGYFTCLYDVVIHRIGEKSWSWGETLTMDHKGAASHTVAREIFEYTKSN